MLLSVRTGSNSYAFEQPHEVPEIKPADLEEEKALA